MSVFLTDQALDGSLARFSECRRYRYDLLRVLGRSRVCVVNLFAYRSPKPAALLEVDDPVGQYNDDAIADALRRAVTGNYRLFIMLNPSTADAFVDDPTIRRVKEFAARPDCPTIVAAWGGPHNPKRLNDLVAERVRRVVVDIVPKVVRRHRIELLTMHAFGITKDGYPRHPLFLPGDAKPKVIATYDRMAALDKEARDA